MSSGVIEPSRILPSVAFPLPIYHPSLSFWGGPLPNLRAPSSRWISSQLNSYILLFSPLSSSPPFSFPLFFFFFLFKLLGRPLPPRFRRPCTHTPTPRGHTPHEPALSKMTTSRKTRHRANKYSKLSFSPVKLSFSGQFALILFDSNQIITTKLYHKYESFVWFNQELDKLYQVEICSRSLSMASIPCGRGR